MSKELRQLVRISSAVGRDKLLAAGSSGNTSVKTPDGEYMYIKASGVAIKDVSVRRGWRKLEVGAVRAILNDKKIAALNDRYPQSQIRQRLADCCVDGLKNSPAPSVESHLHAVLGGVVIHLHPVVVGAYVCSKNGEAELGRLFKEEKLPPLWISNAITGYDVAKKFQKSCKNYKKTHGRKPQIVFLQSHGLFISAGSAEEALRLVKKVIKRCKNALPKIPQRKTGYQNRSKMAKIAGMIRNAIYEITHQQRKVVYFTDGSSNSIIKEKDIRKICGDDTVGVDEFIYVGGAPVWLDGIDSREIERKIKCRLAKGFKIPAVFLVKGVGVFVAAKDETAVKTIKNVAVNYLMIRRFAVGFGGAKALTRRQQEVIRRIETAG